MTPGRRALWQAVVGCALGGVLVLVVTGRQWAHTTLRASPGTGVVGLSVDGRQVAPSLEALGFALLALALAIVAARGVLRRIVGVLVVFVAALTIGVAVTAPGDVDSALEHREVGASGIPVHAGANGWWVVALVGGLLCLVTGALTVWRSARWAAMGSAYDAPAAPARPVDPVTGAWDALDRGEDPTA